MEKEETCKSEKNEVFCLKVEGSRSDIMDELYDAGYWAVKMEDGKKYKMTVSVEEIK
jgi:hypothetical protein